MARRKKKKCRNCWELFQPNPQNATRQIYCKKPACRKASKAESQRRWREKNPDYFRGATNVKRVQEWRTANPGYSRRQYKKRKNDLHERLEPEHRTRALEETLESENSTRALQETLEPKNRANTLQETSDQGKSTNALQDLWKPYLAENMENTPILQLNALQETLSVQQAVLIGLIANFTDFALQDSIDNALRRMHDLGLDIINHSNPFKGGQHDEKNSHPAGSHPKSSKPVQLGRSPTGS
jgi:hypothetical protein